MPKQKGRNKEMKAQASDPLQKYRNSSYFESTLHQMRAWIDDDPVTRGYAGMTDAEVAADMLLDTTTIQRESVNGDELLENTDANELDALRNGTHTLGDAVGDAAKQQQDYRDWVNLICIDTRNYERQGRIVKIMRMVWGNTSQTFQKLTEYYNNLVVDRGTWLINRVVTEQDVTNARAL